MQSSNPFLDMDSPDIKFPFSELDNVQILEDCGMRWASYLPYEEIESIGRDNYIANFFKKKLALESRQSSDGVYLDSPAAILSLPVELICEVFGHLHPLDLYNFIRTTKSLRQLLLSRGSMRVWEASYRRHPEVLQYPPDVSPPNWTSLLFGPSTCDICPCFPAMVDFTYRLRLCKNCTASFSLQAAEATTAYDLSLVRPWEATRFWTLVRYTYRRNHVTYPTVYDNQASPRYAREDVLIRATQVNRYLTDMEENLPNAKQRYDEFAEKTFQETRDYVNHAKACHAWCLDIWNTMKAHFNQKFQYHLLEMCIMYLVNDLGHHPDDVAYSVPYLRSYFSAKFHPRFNKREIMNLAPVLVKKYIMKAKTLRIAGERKVLLEERSGAIDSFYRRVVRPSLPPTFWDLRPPALLYNLPGVAEYINSDLDVPGEIPEEVLLPELSQFITQWVAQEKKRLVHLVLSAHPNLEDSGEKVLDLALAIFTCERGKLHALNAHVQPSSTATCVAFGWQDAHFYVSAQWNLKVDSFAYGALCNLLSTLGLDPNTTSASMLTELNPKFVCMHCWNLAKPAQPPREVHTLSWKDCVTHHLDSERLCTASHAQRPVFGLLEQEIAKAASRRMPAYPDPASLKWSCMLCLEHVEATFKRQHIVTHVKQKHGIAEPVENRDLFFRKVGPDTLNDARNRRGHLFVNDEEHNLACLVCQGAIQLWHKDPLLVHLRGRHQIQDPKEDTHFKRRKLDMFFLE